MNKQSVLRIVAFMMALTLILSFTISALAYDTIPYGEHSDNVRKLQKKLKSKGYYAGSVDGTFGPATKRAVMKYQSAIGIHADGKPGNKTLTALYEGVSKINLARNSTLANANPPKNPNTLYYGCTGSRVKALQRALKKAGCYGGAIDGVYGDLTMAAVKKYQYKRGLHADGMAGTKTISSINRVTKSAVSGSFLLARGSKGAEVKKLQGYLDYNGYTNNDAAGEFGGSTQDAVMAWQSANGYNVTGAISQSQYNALFID